MSFKSVINFFIIFFGYYFSAKIGALFNVPPGVSTAFWPAAGVALAGMVLCGNIYWPSVFLGSLCFLFLDSSVLFKDLSLLHELGAKFILALSATLQAMIGALFIQKTLKNKLVLAKSKDIIEFMILAGPISCLLSAATGIVLLVIYNQLDVAEAITQFFIWWLGQCFGVFVVVPVIFAFFGKPENIWGRRKNTIVIPVSAAFLALILSFNFFKQLEFDRIKSAFEKQVEIMHQLLEKEFSQSMDVLYSLESFYASSVQVNRKEFRLFASNYMKKSSGIKALGWLPRIKEEEKIGFEQKISDELKINNFKINELNQNQDFKAVSLKPEYYPFEFYEPFLGNGKWLGYDVSSRSEYAENLNQARDLGAPIASLTAKSQSSLSEQRLIVFVPIYFNNLPYETIYQRRQNIHGFIIGEYNLSEIIKTVTEKVESAKINLGVYDITHLLPTDLTESTKVLNNKTGSNRKVLRDYKRLKLSKFLNIASRKLEVDYTAADRYIQEEQSWNLWVVLIGAVASTSLLSIFLLIVSGRTTEIEELIKEKSDELKAREERFNLAVQGTTDGLWDWYDLEKDQQWWSPRFYEITGYLPQEIKSSQSSLMGLIHSDDRAKVVESRQNHFEKGELFDAEFRLLHKSGQYRWCRIQGKAYRNDKNQFVRMMGNLIDVNDQRMIEESLKEERLKTLDLTAAAQTAVRLKQEFLANVSHEIRSPMNAIIGFGDLLSKTALDDKQRNYLESIQSSGRNLLDIINDLFDFSRLERGQIFLEPVDFDLEYLINNIIHNISLKLKELPISIYADIDMNVPRKLLGDATRIRQILMHFLNNSIKFTRQGEISVHVDLAQESDNDQVILRFMVRDTGVGIPKEKQKQIFEPFSYVDSSTERQLDGLGLGLAISKKMVDMMGGEISVNSEQGKGSEFSFTLNLRKSRIPNIATAWLLKEELKNRNVFILDNNRKAQEIIYQYCREIGLNIVGVADYAQSALNKLDDLSQSGNIPEVIFCEMIMSGMNPEDFVQKLKAQPLYRSVKIVAVTSNAQPGVAKYVQKIGFDGYLSKPINKNELEGVLRVLLSQQQMEGFFVTRHLVKEMSCAGISVLVAEDVQTDLDLIKAFLETLECDSVFVRNGQEVVQLLKEKRFDICLMDIYMPGLDGIAAAKIIRDEISKDLPIIAISAAITREDQEKCFQVGMNYFITKPLNLVQLRELIIRYGKKKLN